jgi:hypothetical protein
MKSLGNKFIQTRTGPFIQIAEPSAADTLLDLALESARNKQRLLFFCGCQWPMCGGEIACHRTTVAELVWQRTPSGQSVGSALHRSPRGIIGTGGDCRETAGNPGKRFMCGKKVVEKLWRSAWRNRKGLTPVRRKS